ncbi:hypothetical protein LAZ67_6003236 [Cordylochernes scorpioides]|uniref:Uncharacterized protein n=1 Tax=Cordylochernes scorpioides TaxID=51811 RepID=A0ABY6KKE0_9ARAC|nr:hypothetical protein LAZ67_6003236 [Cordylochernes scorpioides]
MPGHRKRRQFKQTDAFTRGMVIGLKRAVIVAVYACGVDVEKGPIRQQLWNAPPCDNVESWRTPGKWTPVVQEIETTRVNIADARVRQASSTHEQCVYIEHCLDFLPHQYLQAVNKVVGGASISSS